MPRDGVQHARGRPREDRQVAEELRVPPAVGKAAAVRPHHHGPAVVTVVAATAAPDLVYQLPQTEKVLCVESRGESSCDARGAVDFVSELYGREPKPCAFVCRRSASACEESHGPDQSCGELAGTRP